MSDPRNRPPASPDPSMEDILASIRRILNDDDGSPRPAAPEGPPPFDLSAEMIVREPTSDAELPPVAAILEPPAPPRPHPTPVPPVLDATPLAEPTTVAAASAAIGSLMREARGRRADAHVEISRGGNPTLEDMVRDELRPLLKHWLDANLPPLVERLVRAEIERLVASSGS